jgi:gamma-glutamyltranspeptidase/glutathione hydrolase
VYRGTLAQAIDAAMEEAGGFLSARDLAADRAEWWTPISIKYRGLEVVTPSAPAGAFPMLVRLGMMGQVDNRALGHNSVAFLHRFAEVTKHAYWTRLAYSGDPEVKPPPYEMLLSPRYWREQDAKLDLERATEFDYSGIVTANEGQNTTHFVVADSRGNVVSATVTLGNLFGSRIMPEGTGIWLNNSLAYCTFEPAGNPMDAHPGRRKLSSDSPSFVMRDGRPWVALGTPGGHTITQTCAQMIMNVVDFDLDIQAAIAAPRIAFNEPDHLDVEEEIPAATRAALAEKGHRLRVRPLGNAHGLMIEYDAEGRPCRFLGGADPRGTGRAEGY